MNALFLYSRAPGNGKIIRKFEYVVKNLNDVFDDVTTFKAENVEQLLKEAKNACGNFDVLIFAGGDGTFNHIINAISKENKRPILGYIPAGTLNDFGKNFGITKNIRKALRIIKKKKIKSFDIGVIDDYHYFCYVAAIGTFSEISYTTKRRRIKAFGKMAYYMRAVKDAIVPRNIEVDIEIDNIHYHHRVPFFLLLNSKYVGGFPINRRNSLNDGKFDVYLTKPGIFNGLLNYFCLRSRTAYYRVNKIHIAPSIKGPWCIDGEEGMSGDLEIVCLPNHLFIFSNK